MADFTVHAAPGKGGCDIDSSKTAVVFIEYQNEFTTEGGKLHPAVKANMADTNMLENSSALAAAMRAKNVAVFHAPISFQEDGSDNPNPNLGILAGCAKDKLFTAGTWNAEFSDAMKPAEGDVIVQGKRNLSAFPGTDLEEQLKRRKIETVAFGGFMANCCVESTMRDAYQKGYNVITLTDCVATTSTEGYKASTDPGYGSYGMFSKPMTAAEFTALVPATDAMAGSPSP
jgi:nicotinamidase-related amidase